jgi:hypothetical protein
VTSPAAQPPVRFGITVDSDNGYHVHFRVFSATGGEHLGGCGKLVMRANEFDAFQQLLEPQLTDRSDAGSSVGVR